MRGFNRNKLTYAQGLSLAPAVSFQASYFSVQFLYISVEHRRGKIIIICVSKSRPTIKTSTEIILNISSFLRFNKVINTAAKFVPY